MAEPLTTDVLVIAGGAAGVNAARPASVYGATDSDRASSLESLCRLVGLAAGLSSEDLGLSRHLVDARKALEMVSR